MVSAGGFFALGFAATFDLVLAPSEEAALVLAFFFTARVFLTGALSADVSVEAGAAFARVFFAAGLALSEASAATLGFLGARGFFTGASAASVGALGAVAGAGDLTEVTGVLAGDDTTTLLLVCTGAVFEACSGVDDADVPEAAPDSEFASFCGRGFRF